MKRILSRIDFEITKLQLSSFLTAQKCEYNDYSPDEHLAKIHELREKYNSTFNERVLLLSDDFYVSPGGYSALSNLANGLHLINCDVILSTELDNPHALDFNPTIILFSDTPSQIKFIKKHRSIIKKMKIKLGISFVSNFDNSNVEEGHQYEKYKLLDIDLFWGFKNQKFYNENPFVQKMIKKMKKPIIALEFSADLVNLSPNFSKRKNANYDFVFLASRNLDKWSVLKPALMKLKASGLKGSINGPGWNKPEDIINKEEHIKLYNNSRIGLNMHIPMSRDTPTELNERFYNLILSGIPQVVDNISLIDEYGLTDCVSIFDTDEEMLEACNFICLNPLIASERAYKGYKKIMSKHTNIHRAYKLLLDLKETR